ncbi:MAG: hypothetical protein M3361_02765 [Candidatus Tectomicrobia bacterium]|nr:hypothetical protein [Candidatus Tectomicrobia bacterium]
MPGPLAAQVAIAIGYFEGGILGATFTCINPTPFATPNETKRGGGPSASESLSLGDAPVLPSGGGAARARLHGGCHHEHRRCAAPDPAGLGDRRGSGVRTG